jgi:hypothetical protein
METYIKDLFRYIETYEQKYAEFDSEAFFQTYNGIFAMFHALREQRDQAMQVDGYFLKKLKAVPMNSSDLRQITLQILITFFESEADTDGKTDQSYYYVRSLRSTGQDVPFFTEHLVPMMFREGALNQNFELNEFFLNEIARYLNKFGRNINANISPEEFDALSDPLKFLELIRRRIILGKDLLKDHGSLEFHLNRINAFEKISRSGRLAENYLTRWSYLQKSSFWSKVTGFLKEARGKLAGIFSNWRYFRLVMTQRKPAYFLYALLILFFIWLAIYVPMAWNGYNEQQYEQFQKRAENIRGVGGK